MPLRTATTCRAVTIPIGGAGMVGLPGGAISTALAESPGKQRWNPGKRSNWHTSGTTSGGKPKISKIVLGHQGSVKCRILGGSGVITLQDRLWLLWLFVLPSPDEVSVLPG